MRQFAFWGCPLSSLAMTSRPKLLVHIYCHRDGKSSRSLPPFLLWESESQRSFSSLPLFFSAFRANSAAPLMALRFPIFFFFIARNASFPLSFSPTCPLWERRVLSSHLSFLPIIHAIGRSAPPSIPRSQNSSESCPHPPLPSQKRNLIKKSSAQKTSFLTLKEHNHSSSSLYAPRKSSEVGTRDVFFLPPFFPPRHCKRQSIRAFPFFPAHGTHASLTRFSLFPFPLSHEWINVLLPLSFSCGERGAQEPSRKNGPFPHTP